MQMLAYLLMLPGVVCGIIILIHAFKESVGQGLLCLCVPFYVLYYAFVRFQHEKKNLILAVWLGSLIVGAALNVVAAGAAISELPSPVE